VLYQLRIAQRAVNDLHEYLDRKVAETRRSRIWNSASGLIP